MNALGDIFRNMANAFSCAWQVLRYLGGFCWAMLQPKAVLAARILALQSQLAVCKHRIEAGKAPPPRFNQAFRILWVVLAKLLDRWEDLAQVMKPATVVKWHRTAFRLFWRWKSKPGRPEIKAEMQALIRGLSTENPLWGAEHIRQQLKLLGYDTPCADTILKYMAKPRRPHQPSTTTTTTPSGRIRDSTATRPFRRSSGWISPAPPNSSLRRSSADSITPIVASPPEQPRVLRGSATLAGQRVPRLLVDHDVLSRSALCRAPGGSPEPFTIRRHTKTRFPDINYARRSSWSLFSLPRTGFFGGTTPQNARQLANLG